MGNAIRYHHTILEATPYHVGWQEGEFLKQAGRALISYNPPEPERTAATLLRLYDMHCPGLAEEIRGAADSLRLPFEKVLFCAVIGPAAPGCTHAVALPQLTADRHLLIARNYDMALSEADLRLCTTRIEGRFNHLGFSDMCFGRLEGINEHGLCFTHSTSRDPVPEDWREPDGLHFAIGIRAALEQCRNIEEALDVWQCMPIAANCTFLVADPSGKAARIETAGKQRAIQRIGPDSGDPYLVSTNHFTQLAIPYEKPYTPSAHSTRRYGLFASWLAENRGRITPRGLKAFLDRGWENGVSGYSPEHRAGTLWSMVMDATSGKVDIRFGPPPDNDWHSFSLDGTIGLYEYSVCLPGM